MKVKIASDSVCDLSPEQVKKYALDIVPLYVMLGGKEHRDGVDITPDDIYAHVAAGGALGSTAAVSVADYIDYFRKELEGSAKATLLLKLTPEHICGKLVNES